MRIPDQVRDAERDGVGDRWPAGAKVFQFAGNQPRVHLTGRGTQGGPSRAWRKGALVLGPATDGLLQRLAPGGRRGCSRLGPLDDQLGEHRIVVGRDHRAGLDAGVDADAGRSAARTRRCGRSTAGSRCAGSSAQRRTSTAWPVMRIASCAERQLLARRDAQLPLHQVEAGDQLGDGMLHLQARVHLEEVAGRLGRQRAALDQELDRARALVADRLASATAAAPIARAQLAATCRAPAPPRSPSGGAAGASSRARTGARRCRGCRRTPAPRCGAAFDYLLEQHAGVAEGSLPRAARLPAPRRVGLALDDAHAAAAAAGHRLDHDGIADALRPPWRAPWPVLLVALVARHHRHAAWPPSPWPRPCRPCARIASGDGPMKMSAGLAARLRRTRRSRRGSRSPDGSPRRRSPCAAAMILSIAQIALGRRRRRRSHRLVGHRGERRRARSASE